MTIKDILMEFVAQPNRIIIQHGRCILKIDGVKFSHDTIMKTRGCFNTYFSSQLSYLLKNNPEKGWAVKSMLYLTSETHGLSLVFTFCKMQIL